MGVRSFRDTRVAGTFKRARGLGTRKQVNWWTRQKASQINSDIGGKRHQLIIMVGHATYTSFL
jgi:hypothetical protein